MNKILQKTTQAIIEEIDSEDGFDKSFDLVDQLLQEYGEIELAEKLFEELSGKVAWEVISELFGILVWSTSDNGSSLLAITNQWLQECNNIEKVKIALNLDCYPFKDKNDMMNVLNQVGLKYPEVKGHCQDLVESRFKLNENQT